MLYPMPIFHPAAAPSGGGSGLITANLAARFETDSGATAAAWTDSVGGVVLADDANTLEPSIIAGGTPTGQDYYQCLQDQGFLNTSLSGSGWPQGASARTLFLVARYKSASGGDYQGFVYGTNVGGQAFGITAHGVNDTLLGDYWGGSIEGPNAADDVWRVFCLRYSGTQMELFRDDVSVAGPTTVSINTTLVKAGLNESLSFAGRAPADYAAILLYSADLSASDRTQVHDYLRGKYIA